MKFFNKGGQKLDSYNNLPWNKIEYLRVFFNTEIYNKDIFSEYEKTFIDEILKEPTVLYDVEYLSLNTNLIDELYKITNRVHVETIRYQIMRFKKRYSIKNLDDNFKLEIFQSIKDEYLLQLHCDDKLFELAYELIWEYMTICYSVWEYMTYLTLTEAHTEKASSIKKEEEENQYKTNVLRNTQALDNLIDGKFLSYEDIITIDEGINIASKKIGLNRKSLARLIFLEETAGNSLKEKYNRKIDTLISNALVNVF